jgi:hypothetical protein
VATNWNPLNDDPVSGDLNSVAHLTHEGRAFELRACFAGPTPPVNPVEGQFWLDTSTTPYRLKEYVRIDAGGPSWQPVGPLSRLPASINADPSVIDDRLAPFQYLALRIENRAALPAASPLNAGLLVYRIPDGEVFVADMPVSGGWKALLSVTLASSYDTVELPLEGDLGNDATNPPTKERKGALEGWLFDDVAEKRAFAFVVPKNWQGATDLKLRLFQVLGQAQLAGDDIEWSGEVRTLVPAQENVAKAATALVDAATDVGADVDGIADGGGPHVTELVVNHDDATNPVSTGCLVLATVWRKSVGGAGKAGGVVVFRADLAYAQRPRHERA